MLFGRRIVGRPSFVRSAAVIHVVAAALAACGGSDAPSSPGGTTIPPPGGGTSTAKTVNVSIAVDQDRAAISPLIYGTNQDAGQSFWTVRRNGGNRATGYDWENNFSNAGNDYFHNSDLFNITSLGLPSSDASIPGRAVTYVHDQSLAMGAQTIITLQMAGYVAADGNGPVTAAQTAPSTRWVSVLPKKPGALSLTPDLTDGAVYMDELVNLFVQKYGPAGSARGVRFYSLDNEPAIWSSTHPRIHPQPVGAAELLTRSIALAAAVKGVDPQAEILGPAEYGIQGYYSLQSAPDWPQLKGSYDWFLDYYLDGMKKAGQSQGRRLLDVLDVHWYPEARGDNRIVDAAATTPADAEARLQAPRTLWDPTYKEKSWVQDVLPAFLPILPRLQRSIAQYYPGTKLAITEYDFGGKTVVSGGLAQADVLGAFGRNGVFLATMWGLGPADGYAIAAFKLYRDFDGQKGRFGDTSVRASADDVAGLSVYASTEGTDDAVLHLILINKDKADTVNAVVRATGDATYTSGTAWGFGPSSPQITARPAVTSIVANGFTYPVPPLTAVHVILRK
jgi:mannan endo-1,4-beta-mannosidase